MQKGKEKWKNIIQKIIATERGVYTHVQGVEGEIR